MAKTQAARGLESDFSPAKGTLSDGSCKTAKPHLKSRPSNFLARLLHPKASWAQPLPKPKVRSPWHPLRQSPHVPFMDPKIAMAQGRPQVLSHPSTLTEAVDPLSQFPAPSNTNPKNQDHPLITPDPPQEESCHGVRTWRRW